jgi:hypothetical protein
MSGVNESGYIYLIGPVFRVSRQRHARTHRSGGTLATHEVSNLRSSEE